MASTQQSSVNILTKNKVKLVGWLSKDFQVILQNVQCEQLVDDRVYHRLRSIAVPEDACIFLIDTLMNKGEGVSSGFLQLLKNPEVHSAYNEKCQEWILSLELLPPAGQTTPQKANTSHPVTGQTTPQSTNISHSVAGQTTPQKANTSHSVLDKKLFFKEHRAALVSSVRNVGPIVDYLQSITGGIHDEMAASIHADPTSYQSVRSILDAATSSRAREDLFNALLEIEAGVMHDLLHA